MECGACGREALIRRAPCCKDYGFPDTVAGRRAARSVSSRSRGIRGLSTAQRHRSQRYDCTPDPAQRLTPLPLRQADGKPPDRVKDRERAEHDKENGFVHEGVDVGGEPMAVNAIKRRGQC